MTSQFRNIKTLVVKVGTTLLSGEGGFDGRMLDRFVKEVSELKRERGLNVLIVSSGAVGCGMNALGIAERPKSLPLKQAVAAIGQSTLMHYYETLFRMYGGGMKTAQVLLSASDLDNRQSYLNVRNTIKTLLELSVVVPVVNENDSVATEELKFGDNDTLAAKIAGKIDADLLIILSDVDGLYDKNPAQHESARFIPRVEVITGDIESLAEGTGAQTSVGGMKTKIAAARIACAAGVPTVIANGRREGVLRGVLDGVENAGTVFVPSKELLSHRKRWIAFGRATQGALRVDPGAARALLQQGKSLLAAGVTEVTGRFASGAAVKVRDPEGREIACGLVNYASEDLERIRGRKSAEIEKILGRKDFDEVIHRDNLVLL